MALTLGLLTAVVALTTAVGQVERLDLGLGTPPRLRLTTTAAATRMVVTG